MPVTVTVVVPVAVPVVVPVVMPDSVFALQNVPGQKLFHAV